MTEKRAYILLTDTGTLFTKLIKLYTKKIYNHASIAFDSNLSEVYSFGRKEERNPFIGGFVQEDPRSGLFKNANCALYSFPITDEQLKNMKQYIEEIKEEDYRYNFLGLFGFLFNKPLKRDRAFFCSQFVASVLKEGKITHFRKPLELIAPHDLEEIPELQLEFQGRLKDYHIEKNSLEEIIRFPQHFIPIEM